VEAFLLEAALLGLELRGILNQALGEDEGEDADRDVDIEDPAPGDIVGE